MRGFLYVVSMFAAVMFNASPSAAVAPAPPTRPPAPSATVGLSIEATPAELHFGQAVRIDGVLTDGPAPNGQLVELQASTSPYRRFADVAHAITRADGSFAFFPQRPDRNTRYRAVAGATHTTSPVREVLVDPRPVLRASSRGPGRVLLTLVVTHSRAYAWRGTDVWWFVAAPGTRTWRLAGQTVAADLRPGVTLASVTVNPPSRHFRFRACLNPPGEMVMGPASAHGRCPHTDYAVSQRVR